jgi:hypothetical protein
MRTLLPSPSAIAALGLFALSAFAGLARAGGGDGIVTHGATMAPDLTRTTFSFDNENRRMSDSTFFGADSGGFGYIGQGSYPLSNTLGRPHVVYQLSPAALDGRIRVRVNPSGEARPPQLYLMTRLSGSGQTGLGVWFDADATSNAGQAFVDTFATNFNDGAQYTSNNTPTRAVDEPYWLEIVSSADAITARVLDDDGTSVLTTLAGSLQRSQTTTPGFGLLMRGLSQCCGPSSGYSGSFDDLSFMSLSRGSDANTDGKPDLYWRDPASGNVYQWVMDGVDITSFRWSGNLPGSQWRFVGAGNINNVGASDAVWQDDTTGAVYFWGLSNDGTIGSWAFLGSPRSAWRASAIADLNYDSLGDIVFRNQETGENVVWFLRNGAITGFEFLPTVIDQRYQIVGAADLDWDGQNDLLWSYEFVRGAEVAPDEDLVYAWMLNRTRGIEQFRYLGSVPAEWRYVGAGDFDRDRSDNDLIWHNRLTGSVGMWSMQNASIASFGIVRNVGTSIAWEGGN